MIRIYKNKRPDVEQALKDNDGYCPCAISRNEDTKCMCRDFREMREGTCPCGLYRKERSTPPLDDPNERRYSDLTAED